MISMGTLNTALDTDQQCFDFYKQDCMISAAAEATTSMLTAVNISSLSLSDSIDLRTINPTITLHSDTIGDANLRANSNRISLTGNDADIEINGESVVGVLREIRDRLSILKVSETMEAEWNELRELREHYEAKLAECREKSRAWGALSAPEKQKDNK